MEPFAFPGRYEDQDGSEEISWRIEPSRVRGYEIHTLIRNVAFWGYDFDGLEVVDRAAAAAAGFKLEEHGEPEGCVLSGDLPCTIEAEGQPTTGAIRFRLEVPEHQHVPPFNPSPKNLHLSVVVGGRTYEVADEWFEDGVQRLEELLPSDTRFRCCLTCLFSDYSPGGHSLMGMRCHRDAKQQYLAVRSKNDYWSVPVTEEVMETYLCPEYQRRVPGTGYRG